MCAKKQVVSGECVSLIKCYWKRVYLWFFDGLHVHIRVLDHLTGALSLSFTTRLFFSYFLKRLHFRGTRFSPDKLTCNELSPALFDTIKANECTAIRCLFCLIVARLRRCCLCSQLGLSPLRGGSITKWQPLMSNKSSWFSEYWRGSHHMFSCMLREQR